MHHRRLFWMILLIPALALAQLQTRTFSIKYVAKQFVYIKAGSADGLEKGDKLEVYRNGKKIAVLEVVFLAQHSASCKVVWSTAPVQMKDQVRITKRWKTPVVETPKKEPKKTEQPLPPSPPPKRKRTPSRRRPRGSWILGSVAIQWNYWKDQTGNHLDFNQPNLRVRLTTNPDRIPAIQFRFRGRLRYNQRNRPLSPNVPRQEWRNRIYEFSLAYQPSGGPVHVRAGRIIANYFSGVGYIDGVLVQGNLGSKYHIGLFYGSQPEWQYARFQTDMQKYGGYFYFEQGEYQSRRIQSTIAIAGEYHGATISREFLYIQNVVNLGRRWDFYQSTEVDINRGWRKDKTGQAISLTNLYLSAHWRPTSWANVGLSYDNRRNYWTYETRSLLDSLFDDVLRQGARLSFQTRLPLHMSLMMNVGIRKRSTDPGATYSYAMAFYKYNLIFSRLHFSIHYSGFSHPLGEGNNLSAQLRKFMANGIVWSLSTGFYMYNTNTLQRYNQWYRLNWQIPLLSRFYLSFSGELDDGDDIKGYRIFSEFRYVF